MIKDRTQGQAGGRGAWGHPGAGAGGGDTELRALSSWCQGHQAPAHLALTSQAAPLGRAVQSFIWGFITQT